MYVFLGINAFANSFIYIIHTYTEHTGLHDINNAQEYAHMKMHAHANKHTYIQTCTNTNVHILKHNQTHECRIQSIQPRI